MKEKERVIVEPPDECPNKTICKAYLNIDGAKGMDESRKLGLVISFSA